MKKSNVYQVQFFDKPLINLNNCNKLKTSGENATPSSHDTSNVQHIRGHYQVRVFSNIDSFRDSPENFILPFFTRKVSTVTLVKEATPSPDRKMTKLLTFDNCFPQFDILAKTRSEVTTATRFSRQNEAGSPASFTSYRENLVHVVVLVLESKGLYFPI